MTTLRGILGQEAPSATTATELYVVPSAKQATCKVIVAERGGAAATFRVSIRVGGAGAANEQYIAYDTAIAANDSLATVSFMVNEDDEVYVYASSANLSFNCTGVEIDE